MHAEPYRPSAATTQRALVPSRLLSPLGMLVLLALSYLMMLCAPLFSRRMEPLASAVAETTPLASWVSILCATGLALGGAAALVLVLVSLVRDAERRPYAHVGPIVAAFSAIILIGLQPELPLPGVSVAVVAVFSLSVVVAAGSLIAMGRPSMQRAGFALALLPVLTLLGLVWSASGKSDPADALWATSPSTRAFLCMLTLSSFAIALIATSLGRAVLRGAEEAASGPTGQVASAVTPLLSRSREVTAQLLRQPSRFGLPSWALPVFAAALLLVIYGVASFTRGAHDGAPSFLRAQVATAALAPPPLPLRAIAAPAPVTPPSTAVWPPPRAEPAPSAPPIAPAVNAGATDAQEQGEMPSAYRPREHRRHRSREHRRHRSREHRRERAMVESASRDGALAAAGATRRSVAWNEEPVTPPSRESRRQPVDEAPRASPKSAPAAAPAAQRPAADKARGGENLDALIDDVLGSLPGKK